MRELKTSAAEMVAAAKARITEIECEDGFALVGDPNTVIVDIRDPRERQREGFIPGSIHCPRGMLEFWIDPQSPYFKPVFDEDKTFVLHCAGGWRSALAADMMQDMGFDKVAHLTGGFSDWKAKGGPVEMPEPKG